MIFSALSMTVAQSLRNMQCPGDPSETSRAPAAGVIANGSGPPLKLSWAVVQSARGAVGVACAISSTEVAAVAPGDQFSSRVQGRSRGCHGSR
jgi:hypothetical protein